MCPCQFYIVSILHIDDGLVSSQPYVLVRCRTTEGNELINYHGEKNKYVDPCNFTIFDYNSSDEGSDLLELCVDVFGMYFYY